LQQQRDLRSKGSRVSCQQRLPLETALARAHVTGIVPSLRSQFRCPSLAAAAAGIGLTFLGLLISGKLMAEKCPLSAPLVLKDTQSGFAGETGYVWTIAPDCSFTVARQIGFNVLEPYKRGQLTPPQRDRLKVLLDRMTATGLPEQLGGRPQVNARRITLSYGAKQSVLSMPPGGGDLTALRAAADQDSTRLMLELADDVKGMTGG
jgi:hypothetical protein